MIRLLKLLGWGMLSWGMALSGTACAAWPERPITLVVPYPAGGATDVVGRMVAKGMSEQLGVSVVVENRAGASGNIAGRHVARAKPDGHTLFLATTAQSINMAIFAEPGYDLARDFQAVATINEGPMLLLTHPKLPAKSVNDLIQLASDPKYDLRYASAGNGTSSHMTAEIFTALAGIEVQHIPYVGAAPAMNALLGGQVEMTFDALMTTLPHVKEGKLNALGVTTLERSRIAPDIPTIHEQGVPALKGFNETLWNAVLVPNGTDAAVIETLSKALEHALADPAMQARFHEMGNEVTWRSVPASQEFVSHDVQQWRERAKTMKLAIN